MILDFFCKIASSFENTWSLTCSLCIQHIVEIWQTIRWNLCLWNYQAIWECRLVYRNLSRFIFFYCIIQLVIHGFVLKFDSCYKSFNNFLVLLPLFKGNVHYNSFQQLLLKALKLFYPFQGFLMLFNFSIQISNCHI